MKTDDKPHYYKHSFLDCWMRVIPSQTKSMDDVVFIHDDEWCEYISMEEN